MSELVGTPTDQLPGVLSKGTTDARYLFVSLSRRDPQGRDAEYIEWHSLDHRPEQHRLAALRLSLRLVSTTQCRAARAASREAYDDIDHVMTYVFTGPEQLPEFFALGGALHDGGRMSVRLPPLGHITADLAGKLAAPRSVAGADVIPDRPARGVYLMIERGHAAPHELIDVPGVAGVWWYHGNVSPKPFKGDTTGLQISYLYLDDDPVATAERLRPRLAERWAGGDVEGLLAAPFHTIVPFEWSRHLPGG
ncbi:MAG: hypothetical protein AB7O61_23290 [Acidimicrobiia bacterium]